VADGAGDDRGRDGGDVRRGRWRRRRGARWWLGTPCGNPEGSATVREKGTGDVVGGGSGGGKCLGAGGDGVKAQDG
jgi:hypothetical protein